MKKQDFTVLKITDLYPFPDNPFRVVEDDMLMELSESIKEFGMVTPIITRPKGGPGTVMRLSQDSGVSVRLNWQGLIPSLLLFCP